jgi:hypothetical protein
MDDITFAVLGTGGIGRRTLDVSQDKDGVTPVLACDRNGVALDPDGLDVPELLAATEGNIASGPEDEDDERLTDGGEPSGARRSSSDPRSDGGAVKQHGEDAGVVASAQGRPTETPIEDAIEAAVAEDVDAVLMALPNLDHEFIPDVGEQFAAAGYEGVLVDVLKRSRVIDILDEREDTFVDAGITFVCGAGATPGFLTGAAALAAQSFVEVESVDIRWGVGLKSGYEDNRGTVREDIAHLDGYDIETAREMSEAEIEELIDEHEKVSVGGVLDVRSDEKPRTTTVTVTGRTFDGEVGTNTFQLDDDTSMAANVNGPALGYMKAGVRMQRDGRYGVFGPAELMPGF